MRGLKRASVPTVRRTVAVVGASLSLVAVPAIAASAAPTPSPAPSAPAQQGGISLRIGTLSLNVPLSLDIGGILQIGSTPSTSTAPTSAPPSSRSNGGGSTPVQPPPSHHQSAPATHPRTTGAGSPPPPPLNPAGFQAPGRRSVGSPSAHHTSHPPTRSASTSKDTKGTGSLVLTRRLLDNSGEVMIAALLAATAVAVIAFARLGGVRRGGRSPRHR